MRKLAVLSAGILSLALSSTVALADVSLDATIKTAAPLAGPTAANRIVVSTFNANVGVCGLTGTVKVFKNAVQKCVYTITRSSVPAAGQSPIGLHTSGGGCVGSTASPLIVADLVANPGVIVKFDPANGVGVGAGCAGITGSYTFCVEGNTSAPCTPVSKFNLKVNAF